MSNKQPERPKRPRFGIFSLSPRDFNGASINASESPFEREARGLAYIQNAFATLAPTQELIRYGALVGFRVGMTVLIVETALLLAIVVASVTLVDSPPFETLYGYTPLVGTFLEPLWPVLVSLPLLLLFTALGAGAALLRRLGNQQRRALDRFFNPVSPRWDSLLFHGVIAALITLGLYLWGIPIFQGDPTGIMLVIASASALIAWPTHWLWLFWYLPLIRARGSVSMDEVRERIQRQM
jgi:hypothetical protein